MGVEPALSAVVAVGLVDVEPILDVLPIPLILVEPSSARMLFANGAAQRFVGGRRRSAPARGLPAAYRLYDSSGRLLAPEEIPAVRAARGEPLSYVQFDWETPDGIRTVIVSGATIAPGRAAGSPS